MINKGSLVRVHKDGERRRVEDISISDFVFDPFTDEYCEIVDILSREVTYPTGRDHPLYPVEVHAGAVGPGRPDRTVWVSPSQPLYYVQKGAGRRQIPELQRNLARAVVPIYQNWAQKNQFTSITYFALFTENRRTLDVSGLWLSSYSSDLYYEPRITETCRARFLHQDSPVPANDERH